MQKTQIQQATSYSKAGFTLLRIKGKRSLGLKWPHTPYTPPEKVEELLKDWQSNFGILIPEDFLVIDVDPRNFIPNDKPIKRLLTTAGISIKDFAAIVKTGGGGLHIYIKLPKGQKIKEYQDEYIGIEFKTKGRQVVGASCIHPDTKKIYLWVKDSKKFKDIQECPPSLLELITKDRASDYKGDIEKEDFKGCKDEDGVTVKRFIQYLKYTEPAVEGAGGDRATYQVALKGRDFALSKQKTYQLIGEHFNPKCMPPWSENELKSKVINAFRYASGPVGGELAETNFESLPELDHPNFRRWDRVAGKVKLLSRSSQNNVENFFWTAESPLKDSLIFNEFRSQIRVVKQLPWWLRQKPIGKSGVEWSDDDTVNFKSWLSREKRFDVQKNLINDSVLAVSHNYPTHPVRDYLDSLKWDGTLRLEKWLIDYAGADNTPYIRDISKKTLLQAVKRIYRPGCKADHMLILEGKQGVGKSTLVNILGGEYYADVHIDPHSKDTVDALRGRWIVEISELEVFRRSDSNSLKAFISRQTDVVRPAYASKSIEIDRQFIFIGTTNLDAMGQYFLDSANRRYWPVEIKQVDFAGIQAARDQLFAEAADRVLSGDDVFITDPEVLKEAERVQASRRISDAWLPMIEEYIREYKFSFITIKDIWKYCLKGPEHSIKANDQKRIAQCLIDLDYEKKQIRFEGVPKRGFYNPEYDKEASQGKDLLS